MNHSHLAVATQAVELAMGQVLAEYLARHARPGLRWWTSPRRGQLVIRSAAGGYILPIRASGRLISIDAALRQFRNWNLLSIEAGNGR